MTSILVVQVSNAGAVPLIEFCFAFDASNVTSTKKSEDGHNFGQQILNLSIKWSNVKTVQLSAYLIII